MRKHWFKFLLLGLVLVFGIGIWVTLDLLWDAMVRFEAASEIGAVTEYFDRFAQGDYDTAADTSEFPFDEKATREDYIEYLKTTFGSEFSTLRFAGTDGEIEGEKLYGIYADSRFLGNVRLIPSQGERQWHVVAVVEYADPVTVIAPACVQVFANGVAATPLPDVQPIADEDFVPLANLVEAPNKVTYRFEGYLFTPVLTAVTPDGTACASSKAEDGTVTFVASPSEGEREALTVLMSDFATTYAAWIAKDAKFYQLQPMLDRSTKFYRDLTEFVNYWYTDHDGAEFRNVVVSDLSRPADGLFAGTISFDHVVFYEGQEMIYESKYRLIFRQVNGQWLLANLVLG